MGQGVLALLFIALSGYTFLSRFIFTKYRIYKYQGHHLVYKCFSYGLFFMILSAVIFLLSWPLTSKGTFLFEIVQVAAPDISQAQFNFYSILLMALFVSSKSSKYINKFLFYAYYVARNKIESRRTAGNALVAADSADNAHDEIEFISRKKTDSDLDLIAYLSSTDNKYISHIASAVRDPHMLMFTLGSGKCYVGIPFGFDTPKDNEEQKEVVIIPVASGFRHGDDQCFEITTYYDEVIKLLRVKKEDLTEDELRRHKKSISMYKLTIAFSQICSISSFDLSKYLNFKESENIRRDEIKKGREGVEKDERVIN